jgi:undecaprenyl pyrophosphate phosphatase UppP
MQKAAYFFASFFMTHSTMALAHLDDKLHVHAPSANSNHSIFSVLALIVIVVSILVLQKLRRQTQRH